jgi:hypothetical protein
MRNENLKSITAYFSPEEYDQVKEEADDNGVTVSALVRAKLGFAVTHRGAPEGNKNRQKPPEKEARRRQKPR